MMKPIKFCYTYDQYIWDVFSLYLNIINLFLSLLQLLREAGR
jgi:protein lifeguard